MFPKTCPWPAPPKPPPRENTRAVDTTLLHAEQIAALQAEVSALKERLAALENRLRSSHELMNAKMGSAVVCTCAHYIPGELTSGWHCPVHGQRW